MNPAQQILDKSSSKIVDKKRTNSYKRYLRQTTDNWEKLGYSSRKVLDKVIYGKDIITNFMHSKNVHEIMSPTKARR